MTGVLFVCTANVCRSPLAERLLMRQLPHGSGPWTQLVPVASLGARARAGAGMAPFAAEVLLGRGADPGGFVSRPLTPRTVGDPAVVLTAERWHRREVTEAVPRLLRRTFTILEFGRLLARGLPDEMPMLPAPERLSALVTLAASRRGSGDLVPSGLDDLADPIGGMRTDFEQCADRIEAALAGVVRVLTAPG